MELSEVDLRLSDDERVAAITIPGGALSTTVARELAEACRSIAERRSIRVVTVEARSAQFCTGADPDLDRFGLRPDPASALAALRPPVVAAISGQCRAEGLEIALACDIRVGATDSTFALDHVVEGRMPAWGGTQRLPRAIRPGAALGAVLLGEQFDAERAQRLGLLYSVADDLPAELERLTEALTGLGPLALELTKEAVHRGSEMPLRDGLRLEGDLNHQLAATDDRAEGLLAFFEKRPPDFGGR
jgi:enoyl-CoA hydratase/carnithine racemase